jgi:hypothetical protein
MVNPNASERNTSRDVLANIRIFDVWQALTGEPIRGGRVRGIWRDGKSWSVSLNNERGVWHDFVSNEGGGILDLIVRVLGGTRADALRWAAEFAGIPLNNKPLSAADRAQWVQERRALERDLPEARYWRRTAISMAEELSGMLKAGLVDRTLPQPRIGEIGDIDAMLRGIQRTDGAALVAEFDWWREHYPGMTAAMVRAAKTRERSERRAVETYLRLSDGGRRAA